MSDKNISIIEALKKSVESIKEWTNEKLNNTAMTPRLTNVNIIASGWQGTSSPYFQRITCNGVNTKSMVELRPSPEQIEVLQEDEISLMAVNNDGLVTIYAIGDKPSYNITMQVIITDITII